MRIVTSPAPKSMFAAVLIVPLVLVLLAAAANLAPGTGGKGRGVPTGTPALPTDSKQASLAPATSPQGSGTPSSASGGSEAGSTTPLIGPHASTAIGSVVGGPPSNVLSAPQSGPTPSIVPGTPVPPGATGQSLVGTTTDDGVNVRSGPASDYSILVQLPANTRVEILAEQAGWYHIRTLWQIDGWAAAGYFNVSRQATGGPMQSLGSAGVVGVVNLRAGPGTNFAVSEQMPDGGVLEVLALQGAWYKVRSPLGTTGWVAAENVPLDWIPDIYGGSGAPAGAASTDVIRIAQSYLGARYVWGGSDPSGFDCSGLTWYVYQQVGVQLPAGSEQQYTSSDGQYIPDISSLKPGDLVFFERTTDETGITHVGIYAGGGKMIAARSERLGVRYVSLSDPFWSSRFVGGVRPYR